MFVDFFYTLKKVGVPVSPTSFLRLQKALSMGLINSLDDFYTSARAVLVKSERYFDLYDQVFAHCFKGVELQDPTEAEITAVAKALLQEWLKDPIEMARALGMDEKELSKLTPEELIKYFMDRLKEQTEAHHGGGKWIGTGGTSPVGHFGLPPGRHEGRRGFAKQVRREGRDGSALQGLFPGRPTDRVADGGGAEEIAEPGPGRAEGHRQCRRIH